MVFGHICSKPWSTERLSRIENCLIHKLVGSISQKDVPTPIYFFYPPESWKAFQELETAHNFAINLLRFKKNDLFAEIWVITQVYSTKAEVIQCKLCSTPYKILKKKVNKKFVHKNCIIWKRSLQRQMVQRSGFFIDRFSRVFISSSLSFDPHWDDDVSSSSSWPLLYLTYHIVVDDAAAIPLGDQEKAAAATKKKSSTKKDDIS